LTRTILVIDDDAAIRSALALLLKSKGYQVTTAGDGPSGYAKYIDSRPDIVVSDIVMPGHDGIETIRKIRECGDDVMIIAMSGSIEGGADSRLVKAKEMGADRTLSKPFDPVELMAALNSPRMF